MTTELLLFQVGDLRCGIAAAQVREVLRAAAPSPIPCRSPVILGEIDVRGTIMRVASGRRLLGQPPRGMLPSDHLIVLECEGRRLAVHVDEALDLVCGPDTSTPRGADERSLIVASCKTPYGLAQVLSFDSLFTACDAGVEQSLPGMENG